MTRSILIAMAAVAALATSPSLGASTLTWEQEARQYAPYAFGNPIALTTPASYSVVFTADYVPYVNGIGDPSGLTSSNPVDAVATGSIRIGADYIPYVNGIGDPSGLTSPQVIVDDVETGSIESFGDYLPYMNGVGDPSGLTSPHYTDDTVTGSVGVEQPRVDLQAFCDGEGKELAERLYVGFCHLAP